MKIKKCGEQFGASLAQISVVSSQKNSLKTIGLHTVLVLGLGVALWVGAAGGGALGGAQIVHEGQPVLPAEVDKFNLAYA